jgi:stalled ribosome rescue protein Dom34
MRTYTKCREDLSLLMKEQCGDKWTHQASNVTGKQKQRWRKKRKKKGTCTAPAWIQSKVKQSLNYIKQYQAVLWHIDFNKVKCIILWSPGFVKENFFEYLKTESV